MKKGLYVCMSICIQSEICVHVQDVCPRVSVCMCIVLENVCMACEYVCRARSFGVQGVHVHKTYVCHVSM